MQAGKEIIIIIIISSLNPLVVYNTKLQGRSRIRRTHNYTWHRRQKQLNPIVTVGKYKYHETLPKYVF